VTERGIGADYWQEFGSNGSILSILDECYEFMMAMRSPLHPAARRQVT
jgi:hypothetical protein